MNNLILAVSSFIGWAWDLFCVNIPVLNVPFWTIPAAAIAVDLSFFILGKLIGSGVSSGSVGAPSDGGKAYSWRGHTFKK